MQAIKKGTLISIRFIVLGDAAFIINNWGIKVCHDHEITYSFHVVSFVYNAILLSENMILLSLLRLFEKL